MLHLFLVVVVNGEKFGFMSRQRPRSQAAFQVARRASARGEYL
ncbi:hypothetical protein [Lacipirellula sp.]